MPHFCSACNAAFEPGSVPSCPSCAIKAPTGGFPQDARIGTEVAGGQLRIISRIGAGGFGVVYLVETVIGGLRRALKVLSQQWHGDESVQERFINEALVLEQINHPNVARCYAAGRLEDGSLYLLFQLIEGVQLTSIIEEHRGTVSSFDPIRAARIAKQIAAGLRAAHDSGVLHRDLKPDNVLVENAGSNREQVKIVDFGIAKLTTDGFAATGSIVGTPEFLAPEQSLPGTPFDARLDLWQLGATLFTMLTGQPPYLTEHGGLAAIMAMQQRSPLAGPSPSALRPELANFPALEELVRSLLATDVDARPRNANVVCRELARIEHGMIPTSEGRGSRSLLAALCATPSESGWIALHGYLAAQTDDVSEIVHATDEMLDVWPDELRIAPNSLWEASQTGPHPLWSIIRTLDLSARGLGDDDLETLAANAALATVSSLDLSDNQIGNGGLAALAASPHIKNLERLNLSGNRISSQGLLALAKSTSGENLRTLILDRNGIGGRGAEALGRSTFQLLELSLSGNELGPKGATAIGEGPSLASLRRLDLSDAGIGPDGVAALSFSQNLARLNHLNLNHNGLGPGGTATLTLSQTLRSLKTLCVARNNLGRQGLQLMLGSAALGELNVLDFSGNNLGAPGAMLLAGSPFGRRLESLRIDDNHLGDAGIATLLGSAHLGGLRSLSMIQNDMSAAGADLLTDALPQLESLDLSANPIGDESAQAIAQALERLRLHTLGLEACNLSGRGIARILQAARLRHLRVSRNDIGPAGAELIAETAGLQELESLEIAHAGLGTDGLMALTTSRYLGSLRSLDLSSNGLGDDGVTALVASSPRLPRLETLGLENNELSASAAEALSVASLATHLSRLKLAHNDLGDAGAEALARASSWHALRSIDVQGNGLSLGGAAAILTSEQMGMLQRINISNNALTSVVDLYSLTEDRVSVLERTFAKIATLGADFAEQFYEELFARYPSVKPIFANTSMQKQHRHLMSALVLVVDNLRNPETLEKAIVELGTRHHGYRVSPNHYYAVSSTLIDCMAQAAGPDWSDEAGAAWNDAIEAVANTMMTAPQRDAPSPHAATARERPS